MTSEYERVGATAEEVASYRASHYGHAPAVYRVRCRFCDVRLWGSGLGIGSHGRSAAHHAAWRDAGYPPIA